MGQICQARMLSLMDLINDDGWAFFLVGGGGLRACVSTVVIYTHGCSLPYQLKPLCLGPGQVGGQKAKLD